MSSTTIIRLILDNINKYINIVSVVFLIMYLTYPYKQKEYERKISEQADMMSVLQDSIVKVTNSKGEIEYKFRNLTTSNLNNFLDLSLKKAENKKLQSKVEQYKKLLKRGGSVTVYKTKTKLDTIVTLVESKEGSWTNRVDCGKWGYIETQKLGDKLTYDISILDEPTCVIGVTPTGFLGLGKGVPYTILTPSNPNVSIIYGKTLTTMLSKRRRLGIGATIGYGVVFDKQNLIPGWGIIGGISYSF